MKTLIRLQPLRELDTLQRQLNQLFYQQSQPSNAPQMGVPQTRGNWEPAIELQNTDTALILRVQLPGMDAKDLDVQVSRDAVLIAGEHTPPQLARDAGAFRTEFRYGKFHRVVQLAVPVQNGEVSADFKNGILTLTLPKLRSQRPTVVKVSLSDDEPAGAADTPASDTGDLEGINSAPTLTLVDPELSQDLWAATA